MYIRFVVGPDSKHHRVLTGIFTDARLLRERGELDLYEPNLLEEIFDC